MPRVLVLCEYPTLNGGERSLLAAVPALATAGFEICVACPPMGPLSASAASAGAVAVDWDPSAQSGANSLDDRRRHLQGVLRRVKADLLHANSTSMSRLSGPVAQALRLTSLGHLREMVGLSAAAIADLHGHASLLAVSHATRTFHIAQGLEASRVQVLYNGVSLEEFRPRPATGWLHSQLGIPPGSPLVGTIGQLVQRKGVDLFLMAAGQLTGEYGSAHFIVAGERFSVKPEAAEYERHLHELANASGLKGRVHFLGNVESVPSLLAELTLLVHPARQEPLGRVLLEAAACGVPIVATHVGGTEEVFAGADETALLTPPQDAGALAAGMQALLSDEPRRKKLGSAARLRVAEAFDIRLRAKDLADVYAEVMQRSDRKNNLAF